MVRHQLLEDHLTAVGVAWQPLERYRHTDLERQWQALYGDAFGRGMRHRHGERARAEYLDQPGGEFYVVPFLGNVGGPHFINKLESRVTAYECHAQGLPDLAEFCDIEFWISPPDLSWTMIHTHEDFAMGGPYFVRRERLVPPTRRRDNRR